MSFIADFTKKQLTFEELNVKYANQLGGFSTEIYVEIEKLLKLLEENKITEAELYKKVNLIVNTNIEKINKKAISRSFTIIQQEAVASYALLNKVLLTAVAPTLTVEVIDHLKDNILAKNPFFTVEFRDYKEQMKDQILFNVNDVIINKKTYLDAVTQMGVVKDLNKNQLKSISRTMFRSVLTDTSKTVYSDMGIKKVRVVVIDDSRTTNICKKLIGMIFLIEDAPTFPLHYNCRSSLLPVFDDDSKYNTKELTSFRVLYNENKEDTDLKRLKYVFR